MAVTDRMKVLHLNDHLRWAGGIETWLLTVLPLLRERGIHGTVLYAQGDGDLVENSKQIEGIGSQDFGSDRSTNRAVSAAIAEYQPDVLHINGIQNLGAMKACVESTVPVVMTGHDFRTICPASMFYFKRTRRICDRTCGPGCFTTTLRKHCMTPRPQPAAYFYRRARWTMKNAARFDALIAPSQGARGRFEEAGFDPGQIEVLPYFCPMEPAASPRPMPVQKTITFIGRLAENKGWETFIRALGNLPDSWRGLIVGPINDGVESKANAIANKVGCGGRLELQPWASRDAVRDLMRRTTVFTFPSLWPETLGIVGLEALSQGVPVVASDVGGVGEWLEDGRNGFLVSPGDAVALSKAVLKIEGDGCLERFGIRGIETIKERFTPELHVERLAKIYSTCGTRV